MKLSEAMREKNASVLRAIPAEDRKRNGEPSWNNRSSDEIQTGSTFPVHTVQAAETLVLTEKYAR